MLVELTPAQIHTRSRLPHGGPVLLQEDGATLGQSVQDLQVLGQISCGCRTAPHQPTVIIATMPWRAAV